MEAHINKHFWICHKLYLNAKIIVLYLESAHCVHNCNQPYDEMHQGLWLRIKFGFPQTGKGSPIFFEIGWQTPEIH